ncbi:putative transmembrane protein [Agrobacterium tumefaciens str. Kerr 14]|uniref:Putative transmembrane protein n=1 Tax=Agrobacterium tumefaciens str. Kerr 14 TaxID=1183424 RepID=A0A1S7SB73_AGRTU|nr:TrbC/VirB2 family protein [Agrobacterium tumefaciens]CUX65836.1 putative transmembrane protein [Agrobacterium tumefaciens str. Kerr 14]
MKLVLYFRQFRTPITMRDAARFIFIVSTLFLLSSHPSAAQDFSGVTSFLDQIVQAITGPIGIAISALAVMAIGFSFMTGRMDWTFAVAVILGIAIVFGAASFVEGLGTA